jgi:hypothetical protein
MEFQPDPECPPGTEPMAAVYIGTKSREATQDHIETCLGSTAHDRGCSAAISTRNQREKTLRCERQNAFGYFQLLPIEATLPASNG